MEGDVYLPFPILAAGAPLPVGTDSIETNFNGPVSVMRHATRRPPEGSGSPITTAMASTENPAKVGDDVSIFSATVTAGELAKRRRAVTFKKRNKSQYSGLPWSGAKQYTQPAFRKLRKLCYFEP